MSEWQPIATAPKNGRVVDLWVEFHDRPERRTDYAWSMGAWRCIHDPARVIWEDSELPRATHWMHRPEPPVSP
jgi:hypothetical protein